MESINEWVRGLFILFPVIAMATRGFGFSSNTLRMIATFVVGAALWIVQTYTMPDTSAPVTPLIYFIAVLVTGFMTFSLRSFQAWIQRQRIGET